MQLVYTPYLAFELTHFIKYYDVHLILRRNYIGRKGSPNMMITKCFFKKFPMLRSRFQSLDMMSTNYSLKKFPIIHLMPNGQLTNQTGCGPAFFTCVPTQWQVSFLLMKKLVSEKLDSPLILFYFKRENKIRKKTLKK